MHKLISSLAISVGALFTAGGAIGCASKRVEAGHRDLRQTFLALHEEQLIDNLVRLKKGLPIVHIDYTTINAEMTDTVGATVGDITYTQVDNALRRFQGAAIPAADALVGAGSTTTSVKNSGTGQLASKLTLTGLPVIGKNFVYAAYLRFLDYDTPVEREKHMGLPPLVGPVGTEPRAGNFILRRLDCDGWWFVPVQYSDEFRNLGLAANNLAREGSQQAKQTVGVLEVLPLSEEPSATTGPSDELALLARLAVPVTQEAGYITLKLPSLGENPATLSVIPSVRRFLTYYSRKTNVSDVVLGRPISARPEEPGGAFDEVILKIKREQLHTTLAALAGEMPLVKDGISLKLNGITAPVPNATEELLRQINQKLEQQLLQSR